MKRLIWFVFLLIAAVPCCAQYVWLSNVGDSLLVSTRFTPPRLGRFTGTLTVATYSRSHRIALRGTGVRGAARIAFSVSPNPFNLTTTLRYTLPDASEVKITLYDVLGRVARNMDLASQDAGDHTMSVSGEGLASGVYFVPPESGQSNRHS